MSWVPWTCISAVWTETWLLQLNITIKLQVLDYVAVSIVPAPAPHHLWSLPGRSVGLDILYWAGNKRVWSFTITEKAPTYALVGAFFQPGEGPGRGLLCDCETSIFANVPTLIPPAAAWVSESGHAGGHGAGAEGEVEEEAEDAGQAHRQEPGHHAASLQSSTSSSSIFSPIHRLLPGS